MIIDVDTHWEVGDFGPSGSPLEPWRDQLPRGADLLAEAIAGDLLAALAPADRPTPKELLHALFQRAAAGGSGIGIHPDHESTPAERVAWMDRVGIDHCLVNPGGFWQLIPFTTDVTAACHRVNAWLGERLADGAGRLHFTAVVDLDDVDAAVRELEHARSLGARAFFLKTWRGRPTGKVSPGHPQFDPVWRAATALGMVAVIHVGNTSADFTGWADVDWRSEAGAGVAGLIRLANTQRVHVAQNLVAGLLYGGVFARFPTLSVLVEECSAGWLPHYVKTLSRQATSSPILGEWPFSISGAEMLHRNLKLTPLPGFGDDDALDVLWALPDMVVFSSDYPHQEGNVDPIALYGDALDGLDGELRDGFLGGTTAACFAAMGDPLG